MDMDKGARDVEKNREEWKGEEEGKGRQKVE